MDLETSKGILDLILQSSEKNRKIVEEYLEEVGNWADDDLEPTPLLATFKKDLEATPSELENNNKDVLSPFLKGASETTELDEFVGLNNDMIDYSDEELIDYEDGNEKIRRNLDFFSNLTQKTLSDFHVTGSDNALSSELDEVKRIITNVKYKTLIKVEDFDDQHYTSYFSDGSTLVVLKENINNPVPYEESDEYKLIRDIFNEPISLITQIRMNGDIQITETKQKIEKPSEKIFFFSD